MIGLVLRIATLICISSDIAAGQAECTNIRGQLIQHNVHYIPGPEPCTLCVCDNGEPKVCKAILCSPPKDCRSFRVGSTCCEFICLDDVVKPVEGPETNVRLVAGGATIVALITVALIAYRVRKLKRHRPPNVDERSLASIGYISGSMGYMGGSCETALAAWKPHANYLPRGEAPPPYDEAVAQCRQDLNRIHTEPSFHRSFPTTIETFVRADDPMQCTGHYVNVPRPILQIANPQNCYNAPLLQQIHISSGDHLRDPNQLPHHALLPTVGGLCGARLTGSLGAISGRALLQAARDDHHHHHLAVNCNAPLHRTMGRMVIANAGAGEVAGAGIVAGAGVVVGAGPDMRRRSFRRPAPRRAHASLRSLAPTAGDNNASLHLLSASPPPAPAPRPRAPPLAPLTPPPTAMAPPPAEDPDTKSSPRTPAKIITSDTAPSNTLPLTVDKPSCVCSYSSGSNSGVGEETDDYRNECENCKAATSSKWAVGAATAGAGWGGGGAGGSQTMERRGPAPPPPAATATLPQPVTRPRTVIGQPSNWENWFNSIPDSDTESEEE